MVRVTRTHNGTYSVEGRPDVEQLYSALRVLSVSLARAGESFRSIVLAIETAIREAEARAWEQSHD